MSVEASEVEIQKDSAVEDIASTFASLCRGVRGLFLIQYFLAGVIAILLVLYFIK